MPEGVVILLLDWAWHTRLTRLTMLRPFYEILELYGQCVFPFPYVSRHLNHLDSVQ